jgi:hypothetical protein
MTIELFSLIFLRYAKEGSVYFLNIKDDRGKEQKLEALEVYIAPDSLFKHI